MKNKTLILTATHGDEDFSIPVVKDLAKKYSFDWLISNPKALKESKRFVDTDLNRSGPGNFTAIQYEIKRAAELIAIASKYEQVIDIHGTVSNSGLFIILSDPNWQNIELAKKINLENVVLWPSLQPTGPLTQFIPNSLEIECGPKDGSEVAKKLKQVLSRFLSNKPRVVDQRMYIVTGNVKAPVKKAMWDFKETTYKKSRFTPLLVDQYSGIKCYTLQKLNQTLDYNTVNK